MEDDDDFGDLYTDVLQAFPSSSNTLQPSQSSLPSSQPPIDLNINLGIEDEDSFPGASNSYSFTSTHHPADSNRVERAPELILPGLGKSGLESVTVGSLEDREDGKDNDLGSAGGEKNSNSGPTEFDQTRVLEKEDFKVRDVSFKAMNFIEKSDVGDRNLIDKGVCFDDELDNNVKFDVEEDQDGHENIDLNEPFIPGLLNGERSLIPGVSDVHKGDASIKEEQSGEGDDWDSDSEDDLQILLNDDHHGPMVMDGGGMVGNEDEDDDGEPLVIVADGDDPNLQAMEEQEWGEDGAQTANGERQEMVDGVKVNVGMPSVPKIGYSNHVYHPYHSQFKYVRPGTAPPVAGTGIATVGPGPGGAPGPGQIRPIVNMGTIAGRGRGDWRPPGIRAPMQKGFGMPTWGNGPLGRGNGGGLDFTLPSHKTVFEVDIDSFEEKPWKYPGVDITDYFNFGMNEESWKDYCKQLEQLRLESTMQSKIRVYESGRTEQDYDPDMPPELAAATGINDGGTLNANLVKREVEQSDVMNESAQMRPPSMIGRAIPVENGYGERLPSIDTRPPRPRDSDAIIEIVLQRSPEDELSAGNGALDLSDNNSAKDDLKEHYSEEVDIMQVDPEPRTLSPVYPSTNHATPNEERRGRTGQRDRSPQFDNKKEELVGSINEKHGQLLLSPGTVDEPSYEQIDALDIDLPATDETSEMETDQTIQRETKKQNRSSRENRENSKVRSESSRDRSKLHSSVENEAVRERSASRMGHVKRHHGEDDEQSFRIREHVGRSDMERKRAVVKGRQDSYPYRERDPNQGLDRRREREVSDSVWQQGIRTEDSRKREFYHEEMGPGHWGKIRENDNWRVDNTKGSYENTDDYYNKRRKNEEYLRREHIEKEEMFLGVGHREITDRRKRERDDILDQRRREVQPRIRENLDDHHSIRQKDERHRLKQPLDESISKREKLWVSHSRAKDEYNKGYDKDHPIKSEHLKSRARIEDGSPSHHREREDVYVRGNQISNEERRSKHERSSTRYDRVLDPDVSDNNQIVHDKKAKESWRKNGEDDSIVAISKRNHDHHSGVRNETVTKGTMRPENKEKEVSVHRQSSKKHRGNASSDEEQQDSRKGRSKLERWTSHKERDFTVPSKSSSSRVKELERNNNDGSSVATNPIEDSTKPIESIKEKDVADMETKDVGSKPIDDRHLDTVEKLKKRSERFKLPMPSEKEIAMSAKKTESDASPTVEPDVATANQEIKQERPARKRRWVSSK